MGPNRILWYAAVSVFITLVMGAAASFLGVQDWFHTPAITTAAVDTQRLPRWAPMAVAGVSAILAVGVFSLFTVRLLSELKEKEETLRKAEEERLSFAADAAHDLRTPLAILRAHIDSFESNDTTTQLRQEVDHITRIVEQVLAKSRIEAIEVKPADTADLSAIAREMAVYVAPLVIREGRSIEVVGAERPVPVNGNSFAIEQALRNLLENAIKYSSRGTTITIEVTGEPSLKVIDRGRGVPEAERDLIFERFRRADRRGAGSGIGLSIVRRVAEAHGGRVSVADAPEGGAVFTLHFPVRKI